MTKTPQVKPDWNTGIYIGNGVVAEPKPMQLNKYLIKLNVGHTIYNICATSEESAFNQICNHDKWYNPDWGYTVLRADEVSK